MNLRVRRVAGRMGCEKSLLRWPEDGSAGSQRGESFLDRGDVRTLRSKSRLKRCNVSRHSDEHVEKETEGSDENRNDPGTDSGHPAHPRPEFGDVGPEARNVTGSEFANVGLRRDPASDTGIYRGRDGFGMGLFDARVTKAPSYGHGVKGNVRGHVRRSFRSCLTDITSFVPEFQPAPSLAASLSLVLLFALPSTGHAQTSRPIGSAPDGPPDIRASLGECRDDLLRDAWNDILPLEAEAVEREVLALCTERAEAIARFLAAQERLDGALAQRRAAAATAEPGPDEAGMERLRGEIESLRNRIARLEGQPEGPETDAALADLRDDLAAAEADLARMEGGGETSPGTPDVPPPVAAVTDADEDEPSATEIVPPQTGDQVAESIPPPGTDPTGETPVPGAEAAPELPSEGPAQWRVVHAVRRDGGPWQVRLQADRMMPIAVPGATPEAPDTFIFRPVSDPPVTLAVGDILPDGLELLAVNSEGVELGDPGNPETDPVLLQFATAGDSNPGALEWDVQALEGADQ